MVSPVRSAMPNGLRRLSQHKLPAGACACSELSSGGYVSAVLPQNRPLRAVAQAHEALGQLDASCGWARERVAIGSLCGRGGLDLWIVVAENGRSKAAHVVDEWLAVCVPHAATLAPLKELGGVRRLHQRPASVLAARENLGRTSDELLCV